VSVTSASLRSQVIGRQSTSPGDVTLVPAVTPSSWSASVDLQVNPLHCINGKQFGDRCFAAAGPKLWNSLPVQLRQIGISYEQFKRLLETFYRAMHFSAFARSWDRMSSVCPSVCL